MDDPVEFAPDERRTLELAPLWIFSALVGRSRGFGDGALRALESALQAASLDARGLAQDVVAAGVLRRDELLVEFELDQRPVASALGAVGRLLARLPGDDVEHFRCVMADIGLHVAAARGPFGEGATREDMERLRLITDLLEPGPVLRRRTPAA